MSFARKGKPVSSESFEKGKYISTSTRDRRDGKGYLHGDPTCEAEVKDSWMGEVTVAALSMADSYWSGPLLREFLEI